ncbi:MAG: hypothetical protein ACXABY_04560 [Candidatus Thorarchaeota archaeon]|jgi:hypothetical protein
MNTLFHLFSHHLDGYMERWILKTPFGSIRLHHILRSDNDRHLHDHPWSFTSILLTNGYTEVTEDGEKHWPQFSVIEVKAEDRHRLVLSRPVWTLVFAGPKIREWGFWTDTGFVHWQDYPNQYPE